MAYDDADRITVSVSIGQSDIATLAVGDSCHVTLSSHENYSGLITQITPISSSTSRSSVSYTVVVSVQGDVSQVTAGSTAELVFSQADEDSQELDDTNASDSDIPAFEGQSTMENNGL